ncbi:M48 family metallopeptidase [Microbacterium sp. NC79]|uniref:tetratricopeptide repeat protein n=1 Tax=Microbacterium sp. NC79 TaxID=2851009 RepID=UPI001C2BEBC1|nr:hypothetical protein [Microbacterium sp. NC79]MBV0895803.1 hypothetical protein [Microbacterium sp. NC79]
MTANIGTPQQKVKFQRAHMLVERKAYDKAEVLFREIVEIDPKSMIGCQASVSYGELLTFTDPDAAQAVLEAAVENMEAYPNEEVLDWDRERAAQLLAALAEA